jgi:hypothetical protein
MKDLIIGGASGYTWDHLKYWINSIKKSGFTGDIVLVATNISQETIQRLVKEGIILSLYGEKQTDGSFKAHSNGAPHVERFFYMWHWLASTKENYRFVITTDTRDVVFQKNPSEFLENLMEISKTFILASSEGLKYKDEPWGNQNLFQSFGPFFHDKLKEKVIHNVGTIAGFSDYVRDLLLAIFQLSINRSIPIVDQAVYNFLLSLEPYDSIFVKTSNSDGWAIQLGTTEAAIKSGFGDIGKAYKADETTIEKYRNNYVDSQPTIVDGKVLNEHNEEFYIVHQYDRVNGLKEKIMEIYGDDNGS